MTPALRHAGLSDRGRVRLDNEDRWSVDPRLGLYVLADGMGGQNAGALAAEIVTRTLPSALARRLAGQSNLPLETLGQELVEAIRELSADVRDNAQDKPRLAGMGATVLAVLAREDAALAAHMGDSRLYRLRAGKLERLTTDHSVVQLLIYGGELSPEDVSAHPAKGVITRNVGMEGEALPEIRRFDIVPGDRLLMCSDGLTDMLADERIATLLGQTLSLESVCRELIDAANEAGGRDNVTVVVLER